MVTHFNINALRALNGSRDPDLKAKRSRVQNEEGDGYLFSGKKFIHTVLVFLIV